MYINRVRTSQETHYVSATKPTRLMLFGETVAVYWANHTEHTDTLCGQNAELCVKAGGTYSDHWSLEGYVKKVQLHYRYVFLKKMQTDYCRGFKRSAFCMRPTNMEHSHTEYVCSTAAHFEAGYSTSYSLHSPVCALG
jgi:hypothetical protein